MTPYLRKRDLMKNHLSLWLEKKQSKPLKVTCNLNNAACKLKLKDYTQAEKLCTKVLEIESQNVKALYRRAQAYIQTADLELAELDIKKALDIDPNNRDVKLEYRALIEKLWSTIASKSKNIIPVLDFLITKGIEDCDSNVSGVQFAMSASNTGGA